MVIVIAKDDQVNSAASRYSPIPVLNRPLTLTRSYKQKTSRDRLGKRGAASNTILYPDFRPPLLQTSLSWDRLMTLKILIPFRAQKSPPSFSFRFCLCRSDACALLWIRAWGHETSNKDLFKVSRALWEMKIQLQDDTEDTDQCKKCFDHC